MAGQYNPAVRRAKKMEIMYRQKLIRGRAFPGLALGFSPDAIESYEHRLLTGGIGHNMPQEAPRDFVSAIMDAGRL